MTPATGHAAVRLERIRICYLIGHLNFGGAERQVVNLLNSMAPYEPLLILTDTGQANDLLGELDKRIKVIRQPCRLSRLPADVRALGGILREQRVQVLHSHMFWPSLYGALAANAGGVPVLITTEHGLNPWKRWWHRWLERNVISRRAAVRICVSEDILINREKRDGIARAQLLVLPNGTAIRDVNRRTTIDVPRVLAVGRLVAPKDFASLLQAARLLAERGVEFQLDIAGDGPLRDELEGLRRDLSLEKRVHLLGSRSDVAALMDQADIFVISSLREGQPLVLLEAMAAALPIVSTRVGGIPSTVSDGDEAFLVPPGNPEALATSLAELMEKPALAAAMGQRARERAIADFSIAAVADAHLSLYADCLRKIAA